MEAAKPLLQLSIVVPVYNERDSIAILHEQLTAAIVPLNLSWEVIFVDDGSVDGSSQTLRQIFKDDPEHTIVARTRRNFGKSHALSVGFHVSRGEAIVTMDADLQDDPQEIPRLLERLDKGYDLVSGWKINRHDPRSKTIPSRIANKTTSWVTGIDLRDMNCGLKAYRRECAKYLRLYGDLHRFIPVMAHYAGFKITEIPVTHHERQFGQSKYGPRRLLSGGLDLLTIVFLYRFGSRPLHLFGILGGLLILAGVGINAYLTMLWLFGASTLSERPLLQLGILMILIGGQLISTGLIADLIVANRRVDPLRHITEVLLDRNDS